jgi:hypothetical protein
MLPRRMTPASTAAPVETVPTRKHSVAVTKQRTRPTVSYEVRRGTNTPLQTAVDTVSLQLSRTVDRSNHDVFDHDKAPPDCSSSNQNMTRSVWWAECLYETPEGYQWTGPQIDFLAFKRCVANVGDENAAALLEGLKSGGYRPRQNDWDGDTFLSNVPGAVAYAWSRLEFPLMESERGLWLESFREAGYTRDCEPATRPSKPLQIYRGSTADRRLGLSWTTNRRIARKFAFGLEGRLPRGNVYSAIVEPQHLLARITLRCESEMVINPGGLHNLVMLEEAGNGRR